MLQKLIISNPDIMMGKPVIAGTRITVELILEKLAANESIEQLLAAHPRLTREGIQAALAFAACALKADVIDSIWKKEITERVIAVNNGTAIGVDYDEAMQQIERRFSFDA